MSTWCWPSSRAKAMNNLKKEILMDEHIMPLEILLDRLNTDPEKVILNFLRFTQFSISTQMETPLNHFSLEGPGHRARIGYATEKWS